MARGLNQFTGLREMPPELVWLICEHQRLQSAFRSAAKADKKSGRTR